MTAASVNLFTPLWLAWGVLFLSIEMTAIWAKRTGKVPNSSTLSSLVWRFQGKLWRKVIFVIGWIILTLHFFFKLP